MDLPRTGRAWHLISRPVGWPVPDNFALREEPVRLPEPGEVVVRNLHLSVDPYMRGRMNEGASYVPPFELDEPMAGAAVGEVLASRAEGITPGDPVLHADGWREYATLGERHVTVLPSGEAPLTAYLGVLGMTGLTAYAGLRTVGSFAAGDRVFVSGAAGAVGSTVGQMARIMGASQVIGSAGSAEKVEMLTDGYGFDAAFDYRQEPVADQLTRAAPHGISLYFDNVGGEHLEAAIGALRTHGRVVLCGMIAQYNAVEPPPAPRNLVLAVGKRLRLQGMIVSDHQELRPAFLREATEWLRSGALVNHETVVSGVENAVTAFLGMLRGENTGKMIVTL